MPPKTEDDAAATADAVDPAVAQQVLSLLLMHPVISSSDRTVCRLLNVSKAVRQAVFHFAAGAVPFCLDGSCCRVSEQQTVQGFLEALSRPHIAALAGAIEASFLEYEAEDLFRCRGPAVLLQHAAAAAAAAATAGSSEHPSSSTSRGLRLRRFAWAGETSGGVALLSALAAASAASLTSLQWVLQPSAQEVAALAQLTGLRRLELASRSERHVSDAATNVLLSLSCLQHLAELRLGRVRPGQLAWLPPQLRQLSVERLMDADDAAMAAAAAAAARSPGAGGIQLAHLTALVLLREESPAVEGGLALSSGDRLPAGLTRLELAALRDPAPLLELCRLDSLAVDEVMPPAVRQLHRLCALSSLRRARLVFADSAARLAAAAAGGPAWQVPGVTDVQLHVTDGGDGSQGVPVLPQPLVVQLACMTGLISLRVDGGSGLWSGSGREELCEAEPGQLAALLRPLHHLQRLVLDGVRLRQPELRGAAAVPRSAINSVEELMQSIAALRQLRRLQLRLSAGTQLYDPAAAMLAGATQLRELFLAAPGLSDGGSRLLQESLAAAGCRVSIRRS